jgi:hypothetical protein
LATEIARTFRIYLDKSMKKAGKLGFLGRGNSAYHPADAGKPTWQGEMQNSSFRKP